MGLLIVIVVVLACAAALMVTLMVHISDRRHKEFADALSRVPGFHATLWWPGAEGENGIAIDEGQSKICLFKRENGGLLPRVINYRDIISSEVSEDGRTVIKTVRSSQLSGALVGGVLLGGMGAVIGGLSGKKVESKKVSRVDLNIVVNDSTNPIIRVCFLAVESERDSFLYKSSSEQAASWQARLDILIKRADKDISSTKVATSNETFSIADELRKLAELRDSGVLTRAEFAAQKARLLN